MLFEAAELGDVGAVTTLLAANGDPNSADANPMYTGHSALFAASEGGHVDVMRMLIAAGAELDTPSWHVFRLPRTAVTPLVIAIIRAQPEAVELLIAAKARVDGHGDMTSPLHYAAIYHENTHIITALIAAGADVNAVAFDGTVALHEACGYHGSSTIAAILIAAGASVDVKNEKGVTALTLAVRNRRECVVRRLLEAGADPNLYGESPRYTPVQACLYAGNACLRMIQLLQCYGADTPIEWEYMGSAITNWLGTVRTAAEVCAHTSEFAQLRNVLRAGGTFVSPLTAGPDSNEATRTLCAAANRPWSPERHFLYSARTRDSITTLLGVALRLDREQLGNWLPRGCWLLILSHVRR
jgi:ankyrin repeat protein